MINKKILESNNEIIDFNDLNLEDINIEDIDLSNIDVKKINLDNINIDNFDFKINGINIFNPIENNLNLFINAFVKVFGKKYKKQIEENLTKTNFIFTVPDLKLLINNLFTSLKKELLKLKNTKNNNKKTEIIDKYKKVLIPLIILNRQNNNIKKMYDERYYKILSSAYDKIIAKSNIDKSKLSVRSLIDNHKIFYELINDNIKEDKNIKEETKQSYESFFNFLGFKEESFEDYLNNEKLISLIYSKSLMYKIKKNEGLCKIKLDENNILKKYNINSFKNLTFTNSHIHTQILKNFIDGKTSYNGYFSPELKTIVVKSDFSSTPLKTLIHEIGHTIDNTSILNDKDKNIFRHKNGLRHYFFKNLKDKKTQVNVTIKGSPVAMVLCDNNKTGALDEIINDYLAVKVTKTLINKNKNFEFLDKENESTYKYGFEIFTNFFENHFDKIIELKMSSNTKESFSYFGINNLSELATLAKDYLEKREKFEKEYCKNIKNNLDLNSYLKQQDFFIKAKKLVNKIDKKIQIKNNLNIEIEKQ